MTAALYIHIPFCDIRCGYCDFYTVTHRHVQILPYLTALKKEVDFYSSQAEIQALQFETIFFGGGTPSLLTPQQISDLLEYFYSKLNFVASKLEITVETNPNTVDLQKLYDFKSVGVNRLSIGFQSFEQGELEFLDRDHSAKEAVHCFRNARKAGFENISLDLIFGLPGQKLKAWGNNLEKAIALEPDHISAYNLTFEQGTPLTTQLQKGKFKTAPEERQGEMQMQAIEFLEKKGLQQYEISNYARPGFECLHNQKYWDYSSYLGLGASAHSFINLRRFWNIRNFVSYMEMLEKQTLPVEDEEIIAGETLAFEQVYLGLRQNTGVSFENYEKRTSLDFFKKYKEPLAKFFDLNKANIVSLRNGDEQLQSKFLEIKNAHLKLTKDGLLLADSICAEFI